MLAQYVLVAVVIVLFLFIVSGFIQPVVMGFLLALVVAPWSRWLSKKWQTRVYWVAAANTLILIVGAVVPFVFLSLSVIHDTIDLSRDVSTDAFKFNIPEWLHIPPQIAAFVPKSREVIATSASTLGSFVGKFMALIPFFLVQIVIFVVAFFYGCAEGSALSAYVKSILPFKRANVERFSVITESICRGVVLGSFLASVIQGLCIGIAFWIFHIPHPHLFGFLTAIVAFIPVLGAGLVGSGGVIYLWLMGSGTGAVGVLIFTVFASIMDSIVKPWVLKGQSSMHPLLALVSALGGLSVLGITGVVFGPLIAAFMVETVDIIRQGRLGEKY